MDFHLKIYEEYDENGVLVRNPLFTNETLVSNLGQITIRMTSTFDVRHFGDGLKMLMPAFRKDLETRLITSFLPDEQEPSYGGGKSLWITQMSVEDRGDQGTPRGLSGGGAGNAAGELYDGLITDENRKFAIQVCTHNTAATTNHPRAFSTVRSWTNYGNWTAGTGASSILTSWDTTFIPQVCGVIKHMWDTGETFPYPFPPESFSVYFFRGLSGLGYPSADYRDSICLVLYHVGNNPNADDIYTI
jgi:hypothetical protein